MKKIIYLITVCFALFALGSCTKTNEPASVNSNLQKGTWRITLYVDSGKDETSDFLGFSFVFNADGKVVATKGSLVVNGTYSTFSGSSNTKLLLNFGAISPLDELNDDWDVLENAARKIRLQDISGGGSGTDLLTFERI